MLVDFNTLAPSSKIWIFQASRELSQEEISKAKTKLEPFLIQWQSHGKDLTAAYKIPYNQFIIVGVDEEKNNSSGCSVDAMVAVLKEVEQDLQLDLFDRMKVTFKVDKNINTVDLPDFQKYASDGKITGDTTVFNNLINKKQELENNWQVKAKNTWHKRFF